MHWRNMEPEKFHVQPSQQEQIEYETAILYGYQEMDKIIGKFFNLVDNNTTLILSTALSQQPCLTYENMGGKRIYRPRTFDNLLAFAGIKSAYKCSPVMAEEFFIRFENESDAEAAEKCLAALEVDGRPMMRLRRQGTEIYAGCGIFEQLASDTKLTIDNSQHSILFFNIFYQIEEVKSGMHHPDGILWIRKPDGKHVVHENQVSLLSIMPTILEILNVPQPDYLKGTALV